MDSQGRIFNYQANSPALQALLTDLYPRKSSRHNATRLLAAFEEEMFQIAI